jgi:hypothetical protein
MPNETLYLVFNYGLLPAWALLIFAPRWSVTRKLVHSALLPAVIGVMHLVLVFTAPAPDGAGAWTLQMAIKIFTEPQIFLAAWVHFLAFDLFVGAWEARDAARRGIPHLALVPCLIATNQLGPIGLLLYLGIRAAMRRKVTLEERLEATA